MSEKSASMHDSFLVIAACGLVLGLGLFAKFVLI